MTMEMKTAEEWAEAQGIVIVDPDGWRVEGAPAWDEPISEDDFTRRMGVSTIARRNPDGSWWPVDKPTP